MHIPYRALAERTAGLGYPSLRAALQSDDFEAEGGVFAQGQVLPSGRAVSLYETWQRIRGSERGAQMLREGQLTTGAAEERGNFHVQIMELNTEEGRQGEETLMMVSINGNDKAVALEHLCVDVLGLSATDALVFGNDYNDMGMFKWAGRSVVMADAPEEVRQLATELCPPVAQDGVAVTLERTLDAGQASRITPPPPVLAGAGRKARL